ncbi:MAG: leucine-rich repeat domain-containing protein [Prevotella sp.]|nr:leucine-rich repeat domain-containing protein [Prevotella sp.]
MTKAELYTDEWGVTYTNGGRTLQEVNPQLFTCEEYTVPEGVEEVMDDAFLMKNPRLRKIHLPSTLRKLGYNTFLCYPLVELELPEGVNEVPDSMCECCKELKKVVLPSTTSRVRIGAFNGCRKLQEINLPDNIEFFEDCAFQGCESLKQIVLPPKLRFISPELFCCSGIESIEIHESITEIGYWAFWGCRHLKRLVIPESVTSIEFGIVSSHEGFEGIECHAKGYHVENDALIDDEKQELLCCWTRQKHYVVPECVRRIADMGGNDVVETITVRQPIEVSYDTFASDINLKRVDFQGGVSGVFESTFWNCPKLMQNKII